MSDIAIRVENLGKLYHIGKAQQRHDTLCDALSAPFQRLAQSVRNPLKREIQQSWALKDVSFEVKRGEVVGISGRVTSRSTIGVVIER